jgi:hypothetical protein
LLIRAGRQFAELSIGEIKQAFRVRLGLLLRNARPLPFVPMLGSWVVRRAG